MPGTGKTATVAEVLGDLERQAAAAAAHDEDEDDDDDGEAEGADMQVVHVNAMTLPSPWHVFPCIWAGLYPRGKTHAAHAAAGELDRLFGNAERRARAKPAVVIVDEIDALMTKANAVLYSLFEWPTRPGSNLIVVGIANTMDLPERLPAKLRSRLGANRVVFPPYTRDQVSAIVQDRLQQCPGTFSADAIELVSRKVASLSGDIRRALAICVRAARVASRKRGAAATVGASDVVAAAREEASGANLRLMAGCSPLQKLVLVGVVLVGRAMQGREEVPLNMVTERVRNMSAMAADPSPTGGAPQALVTALKEAPGPDVTAAPVAPHKPSIAECEAAARTLHSLRLAVLAGHVSGLGNTIRLNVLADDLPFALREESRLVSLLRG